MLDANDTVLKTFNYYSTKAEIGFLETTIQPDSELIGMKVKDLNLTFDYIVAKIERDGATIVPRGHIVIQENDIIVLGGESHFDKSGQDLIESVIPSGHKWENQRVMDLELPSNRLIIMIQRGLNDIIVPVGETVILKDDTVVMIKVEDPIDFPKDEETEEIITQNKEV